MRNTRCGARGVGFEMECEVSRAAKMFAVLKIIFIIGFIGMAYAYITDSINTVMNDIKTNVETVKVVAAKVDTVMKHMKELEKSDKGCPKTDKTVCKSVVKDVMAKYDADKTGLPDYALESAGGKVINVRDTENYPSEVIKLFGVAICISSNEPNTMIRPGMNPGQCWAFKGSKGSAVIELIGSIYITGVSLEHIPKSVSPTGDIKTAPKDFSIWGLSCVGETEGELLGKFTYQDCGSPLQYYPIPKTLKPYRLIELRVHSNYGSQDFTCIYRLRVHGDLEPDSSL